MTDEDFRALIEQAHQLTELTRHPGWAVLADYLYTTMDPAKRRVLNGNVDDLEDYKSVTGFLTGVHRALDAPKAVNEVAENERARRAVAASE